MWFVTPQPGDAPEWAPARRLLLGLRTTLLAAGVALSAATGALTANAAALGLLMLTAVVSSLPVREGVATRLQPVVAAVLTALTIVAVAGDPLPLLPYLLAPVIDAGLLGGFVTAITAAGMATSAQLMAELARERGDVGMAVTTSGQWMVFTIAVGLLAAWVRRLQQRSGPAADPSYVAAFRLLTQLRDVSRALSGGLDAVSLGQSLLESLHVTLGFDRAVCLVHKGAGGRVVPLAHHGVGAPEWATSVDESTLPLTARRGAGHWTTVDQRLDGSAGAAGVLILRTGTRDLGLVAVEWDDRPPDALTLGRVHATVDAAALQLETALLFDEVRTIATAEERRRLAREIHDGIAQELASLGYLVDDLVARAEAVSTGSAPSSLGEDLALLRTELSRVVGDLRLSIFDLRSEVHDAGGLGVAISDYVQQVGATSDLTVHLALSESPARMPTHVETELLRIVQEAITNARKHARARNLWVNVTVDAPQVRLIVEDDGIGLGQARRDSYGLAIMRERAERIGASLQIGARSPRGTRVALTVAPQAVPAQRETTALPGSR